MRCGRARAARGGSRRWERSHDGSGVTFCQQWGGPRRASAWPSARRASGTRADAGRRASSAVTDVSDVPTDPKGLGRASDGVDDRGGDAEPAVERGPDPVQRALGAPRPDKRLGTGRRHGHPLAVDRTQRTVPGRRPASRGEAAARNGPGVRAGAQDTPSGAGAGGRRFARRERAAGFPLGRSAGPRRYPKAPSGRPRAATRRRSVLGDVDGVIAASLEDARGPVGDHEQVGGGDEGAVLFLPLHGEDGPDGEQDHDGDGRHAPCRVPSAVAVPRAATVGPPGRAGPPGPPSGGPLRALERSQGRPPSGSPMSSILIASVPSLAGAGVRVPPRRLFRCGGTPPVISGSCRRTVKPGLTTSRSSSCRRRPPPCSSPPPAGCRVPSGAGQARAHPGVAASLCQARTAQSSARSAVILVMECGSDLTGVIDHGGPASGCSRTASAGPGAAVVSPAVENGRKPARHVGPVPVRTCDGVLRSPSSTGCPGPDSTLSADSADSVPSVLPPRKPPDWCRHSLA